MQQPVRSSTSQRSMWSQNNYETTTVHAQGGIRHVDKAWQDGTERRAGRLDVSFVHEINTKEPLVPEGIEQD